MEIARNLCSMSKSRNKKKGRQRDARQPSRNQPHTSGNQGWIRRKVRNVVDHPVVSLAGVIAILITLWQVVGSALTLPDIQVSYSDPASPFEFPFVVKNQSWVFSLEEVKWICRVGHMEAYGIAGDNITLLIDNMSVINILDFDIRPEDISNHSCRLLNRDVIVDSLTMEVSIEFKTLSFWSRSMSKSFIWFVDGEHSRWLEGSTIN